MESNAIITRTKISMFFALVGFIKLFFSLWFKFITIHFIPWSFTVQFNTQFECRTLQDKYKAKSLQASKKIYF